MGKWFAFVLLIPLVGADDVCSSVASSDDECFSTLQIHKHAVDTEDLLVVDDGDLAEASQDDPCTCRKGGNYATSEEARLGDIDDLPSDCAGMCVLRGFGQCRNVAINGQKKIAEDHVRCRQRCIENKEIGRNGQPIDPCVAVEVRLPLAGEEGQGTSCEFYRELPTTTKHKHGGGHRCWIRVGGEPPRTQEPTPAPTPACNPSYCCEALTATCLACKECVEIEEYCRLHPSTPGCSNQQCEPQPHNFTLPHKSCPKPHNNGTTCLARNRQYQTFDEAWEACGQEAECGMIMRRVNQRNNVERFYMRRLTDPDLLRDYHKSMRYECPVKCPVETPIAGSACPKTGLECDYTPLACPGDKTIHSTTATCRGHEWKVKERNLQCPDPHPDKCDAPAENFNLPVKACPIRDTDHTTCVAHNRKYKTFSSAWAACGANPECNIITKYEGVYYLRRTTDPDNKVQDGGHGSGSMLYECQKCPQEIPNGGESCDEAGLICDYDPSPCNGFQNGHFEAFAACGHRDEDEDGPNKWVIGQPRCCNVYGLFVGIEAAFEGPVA